LCLKSYGAGYWQYEIKPPNHRPFYRRSDFPQISTDLHVFPISSLLLLLLTLPSMPQRPIAFQKLEVHNFLEKSFIKNQFLW